MEQEEVEKQLQQLIERIKDAANRGKALEIKEFGLFYFDEDGELKFDAADELSTEISFKYAGMKPVELKPERDTSIPSFEEEQEEEDLDDFDFLTDLTEEDDDDKVDEETSDDFFMEEPETIGDEEQTAKKTPFKSKKIPPRRGNNAMVWVVAAVILLAVIIGGYFYLMGPSLPDTQQTSPALTQDGLNSSSENLQEQEQAVTTDEETDLSASEPENSIEENTVETESIVQTPQEIIPTDPAEPETDNQVSTNQSLYGLQGSVLAEANNGYSIVVHSFNSEENAQEAASSLRDDGYRAIVSSRTVSDRTMWRVSVGQFETLTDAQAATSQLPSPYNTQNFIHRIQLN